MESQSVTFQVVGVQAGKERKQKTMRVNSTSDTGLFGPSLTHYAHQAQRHQPRCLHRLCVSYLPGNQDQLPTVHGSHAPSEPHPRYSFSLL